MLAFASAAVTLFWLLGGTLGLETVGGEFEKLARERSTSALALASAAIAAKLAAGGLALLLGARRASGPGGLVLALGWAGGAILTLYGGVLVAVGALVLAGVINPSGRPDEYALRWHVFFWDLWFLLWGVALTVATSRARRRRGRAAQTATAAGAPASGRSSSA